MSPPTGSGSHDGETKEAGRRGSRGEEEVCRESKRESMGATQRRPFRKREEGSSVRDKRIEGDTFCWQGRSLLNGSFIGEVFVCTRAPCPIVPPGSSHGTVCHRKATAKPPRNCCHLSLDHSSLDHPSQVAPIPGLKRLQSYTIHPHPPPQKNEAKITPPPQT